MSASMNLVDGSRCIEALGVAVDNKSGDAPVQLHMQGSVRICEGAQWHLGVDHEDVGLHAVGDVCLGPIEHVLVALSAA